MATGFVDRMKGAGFGSSRYLTQFGKGLGVLANMRSAGTIDFQGSVAGTGNGADTTEDTLFTTILPANVFDANYRAVFIEVAGSFANNAHTKQVRMYFGSGVVFQAVGAGTYAAVGFNGGLWVFKAASNSQVAQGLSMQGATHNGAGVILTGVEADNAAITIKVTAQTATSGASDIVANMYQVTGYN
jgi:hypothetical protein